MKIKLFVGILVLFCAVAISAVAAYFSVIGLAAMFAAAFLPVAIMGTVLESSKLVAAGWLHSNWHNPRVGRAHKAYLTGAILSLMVITSMGIYGYLARAHLEQSAPSAAVQIDIDQKQAQIDQLSAQRDQLLQQQKALNETVGSYLESGSANGASRFMRQQRNQQAELQEQIAAVNQQITAANVELVPLKKEVAGSEAKLGPLKYIAEHLGLKNPEAAVNIVILMLMFAFDPFAVVMMISGTITIGEWYRARREEEEKATAENHVSDEPNTPVEYDPEPEFVYPPSPAPMGTIDTPLWPLAPMIKEEPSQALDEPPEPLADPMDEEPLADESETPQLDARAQLVQLLNGRPELLGEIIQAVEEVRASHEDNEQKDIPWLDPK